MSNGTKTGKPADTRKINSGKIARKSVKWLAFPYIIWMAIFIIVPILLIFYFAFNSGGAEEFHFTFENLKNAIDPLFTVTLLKSMQIAVISTVFCLLLAYPLALILLKMKKRTRNLLVVLFMLPMWMNFLVRTLAWVNIFESGEAGLINSLLISVGLHPIQFLYNDVAVIVVMIYNYLPFMILPIYTSLEKIDNRIIEAAKDLGADSYKVFRTVTLPLSLPGIISGITMVFMPTVTTFAIPRLVGGSQRLIGDMIEKQFLELNNVNLGSAISIFLMILILLSMAILRKFDKDNEQGGVV